MTSQSSPLANSMEARDIKYHLHPSTNARLHEEIGPLIIERGEGIYVEDNNGKRYIEGLAGLWSVAVGFGEERLAKVAYEQMRKLPYSHTFAHRSHSPAIDLAEKLISMSPVPMSKVHFTNSGSEANDTIFKTLWYRSNAIGEPRRTKIISRRRAYHGVTIAAGSATGLPANQRSFNLPLPGFIHTTCPHFYREGLAGESEAEFAHRLARNLEELILAEGPETIAAFIGEPVMGAGGVVVPPPGYWQEVQSVLNKYGILLIADEVITGFGRTGHMFGCQTFHITPDIITLSKQISSSYLPISAFMVNDRVYQPVADESAKIGVFGHGYTGSGHPVAAAVALENINIIEERKLVDNARDTGAYMQQRLREFADHKLVGEVRGIGLIAAIELVGDKKTKTPHEKLGVLGSLAAAAMLENGLIVRSMGDTIAICPPLIITKEQVDDMVSMIGKGLDEAAAKI